ncbi:helix-turn-helix domain-containing protein [Paraburkholderia sp.]|uniref:helix-turn-helix domain-containing protein n=1 Tax=Paraburkholderia sp. TaxID=1926495 RepID=UPI0039E4D41F
MRHEATLEPGTLVTGNPGDEIRRGIHGLAESRLTQAEAARLLGVCERTFRRQTDRYKADGLDGLIDKRLEQISHRRAPVDEVVKLVELYRRDYAGWNVRHFHSWYRREHSGAQLQRG